MMIVDVDVDVDDERNLYQVVVSRVSVCRSWYNSTIFEYGMLLVCAFSVHEAVHERRYSYFLICLYVVTESTRNRWID